MDKVKITQEQAKSFETFRRDQYSNQMIIEMVAGTANGFVVEVLRKLAKSDYDKFLQALVNDYEVEETPEDKVREYFQKAKSDGESADYDLRYPGQERTEAILFILDALNIKIVGINHD